MTDKTEIEEMLEDKDLSKNGNKCIYCGARAETITINFDYVCPNCSYNKQCEGGA